jgi:hypothetical protein
MADDELIAFAQDFRDGILGGGQSDLICAAVCWPLAPLLTMYGVQCECEYTDTVEVSYGEVDHIWIRLADGRALDPTADQFSTSDFRYPPVYLGPPLSRLHSPDKTPSSQNDRRGCGV